MASEESSWFLRSAGKFDFCSSEENSWDWGAGRDLWIVRQHLLLSWEEQGGWCCSLTPLPACPGLSCGIRRICHYGSGVSKIEWCPTANPWQFWHQWLSATLGTCFFLPKLNLDDSVGTTGYHSKTEGTEKLELWTKIDGQRSKKQKKIQIFKRGGNSLRTGT